MLHGVVVTKKTIDQPLESIYTSRRLQLTVIDSCNLSPAIFVYEVQVVDAETLDKKGVFRSVATPVDMTEMPVDTPRAGETLFRKSTVDLLVRSPSMETAVSEALFSDIESLMVSMDELVDQLQAEEVTVTG